MKYFQTDDRDDYFASLQKDRKPSATSLNLLDKNGNVVLKKVKYWKIRNYYKDKYIADGGNGKRIWKEELIKRGYQITSNYN